MKNIFSSGITFNSTWQSLPFNSSFLISPMAHAGTRDCRRAKERGYGASGCKGTGGGGVVKFESNREHRRVMAKFNSRRAEICQTVYNCVIAWHLIRFVASAYGIYFIRRKMRVVVTTQVYRVIFLCILSQW